MEDTCENNLLYMTRWLKTDVLMAKDLFKKGYESEKLGSYLEGLFFTNPATVLGKTEMKNKRYTVFSDCGQELLCLLSLKKHGKVLVL